MLDALLPAAEALQAAAGAGAGAAEAAAAAAEAARRGARETAGMTAAAAGRSAYVPADSLRGVEDPGAAAVAAWLGAVAEAV
jgi:dihydroxyacetone kinase